MNEKVFSHKLSKDKKMKKTNTIDEKEVQEGTYAF